MPASCASLSERAALAVLHALPFEDRPRGQPDRRAIRWNGDRYIQRRGLTKRTGERKFQHRCRNLAPGRAERVGASGRTLPTERGGDRPPSSSTRLFLGQRGAIGAEAVQRIVRKYARLAQLKGITPHTLRHTFAKRILEGGTPAVTVARLLGHGSVETTAIYTQPGWEDRVAAVERRGLGS